MPQKHPPPPVRAHSALSALPPPSALLLPRVRHTDCHRRSSPRARSPSSDPPSHDTALEWLGLPLNFDLLHDHLEIEGYQMYAVEKWFVFLSFLFSFPYLSPQRIVERNRPITVLTVYTGDPSHKVCPTLSSTLSTRI